MSRFSFQADCEPFSEVEGLGCGVACVLVDAADDEAALLVSEERVGCFGYEHLIGEIEGEKV